MDGFAEEVLIELTQYEDFQVIACRLKPGLKKDMFLDKDFIEKLGAHFLLEGCVRMDEKYIKISIKLTDTFTREHLWAEQYKQELNASTLITIQENVTQQIITTIASEYGIISQKLSLESRNKRPDNFSIYEAMLRYYYYQAQLTPETFQNALLTLEQASIKAPNCGIVQSMLAGLYANICLLNLKDNKMALEKLGELAKIGVKLDSNNQFAHIVYALSFFVLNKKEQFFIEIEKALNLNSNSPLRIGSIGFFLCLYDQYERGKKLLDRAMKFNVGFPS